MWNLIKNELWKLHYRKKILITFLILSVICFLICFSTYRLNKTQENFSKPEGRIEQMEENIRSMKNAKINASDSEKANIDKDIAYTESEISKEKLRIGLKENNDNWKPQLTETVKSLEEQRKSMTGFNQEQSKEDLNKQILTYRYMIDHNVKPEETYKTTAYNTINYIFKFLGVVFIAIIIAILCADIVSGEYTPPTMKVLLTRPVSRSKILFSKFAAGILTSIFIIISVELISFILVGVIFGFGNSMYPVVVGTKYKEGIIKSMEFGNNLIPVVGSSYIIPAWRFLIRMFLFQIVFIAACASFCFLLSTILKSSMKSMSLSIILTIALWILGQLPFINKIAPFLFTSYGNVINVLQGNLTASFRIPFITPYISLLVLVIWTAVCYFISHIIFTKKDILI